VVVVQAGAAVAMPWLARVAAVVDQWYSGQVDGDALAAVLFGTVNPSGHLPVTFPASLAQVPASTPRQFPGVGDQAHYTEGVNVGYRWWIDTDHRPLFPFGYGLSYTTFRYAEPTVRVLGQGRHTVLEVRDRVTNTGARSGADVAQVYVGSPVAGEPARQLAGYQRVSLRSGKSAVVSIRLRAPQLAAFRGGRWDVAPGSYRVYVGDSSALAQLRPPARVTVR
jgi:beta-glucosidase